jgi:hypothetical protein
MLVRAPDGRDLAPDRSGAAPAQPGLPTPGAGTLATRPEVIEGDAVSVRRRLRAGVILFESLTGATPSDGVTMIGCWGATAATGRGARSSPALGPHRARPHDRDRTGSDPRRRFRDVAQLRGAFAAAIDASGASAPIQSSSDRPTSPYRRPAQHVR